MIGGCLSKSVCRDENARLTCTLPAPYPRIYSDLFSDPDRISGGKSTMKHSPRLAAGTAFVLASLAMGFAQDAHRLGSSVLQNMRGSMVARRPDLKGMDAGRAGVLGPVDTIVSFDGSYSTAGYGPTGKSQHNWYYTIVGVPPNRNRVTTFRAPIVPVSVELLAPVGVMAYDNGHPLGRRPDPAACASRLSRRGGTRRASRRR